MRQIFAYFIGFLMFSGAFAGTYLPTVDVAKSGVSARAAFGEGAKTKKITRVEPVAKKIEKPTERKVVARVAKKTNTANVSIAKNDVLNPRKPISNIWTMNEEPLRMPRLDEIAVVRSDALLPEESLEEKPSVVARNMMDYNEYQQQTAREIDFLRQEVARLSAAQEQQQVNLVAARPVAVKTPISGNAVVMPAENKTDVNVRREVVPMDSQNNVVARTAVAKTPEPKVARVNDMSRMTPSELKKAFKKTYLSENKHLSTYQIDERYDVASDMSLSIEGFSAQRDLSEVGDGIRPLEVKISFMSNDSALSRDNYNLLSETASVVVNNPKRAIQIAIPESATHTKDGRKLAARRLAIVEQVLRDTGVAEQRIVPVLSQRDNDAFVLRVISNEMFESLSQQKKDAFGEDNSKKVYKNMTW